MRRLPLSSAAVAAAVLALQVVLVATPALAADIRLTGAGFAPAAVLVEVGEDIVWVNQGERTRTVVGEDGTWDSGPLRPGETFTISLREPGTVRYATADGEMSGVIRVLAPAEEPSSSEETAQTAPDSSAETLPDTGADPAPLLAAGLGLIAAGALMMRRARTLR